eukprot:133269-Chlamydomonas_euryale.AAC.1
MRGAPTMQRLSHAVGRPRCPCTIRHNLQSCRHAKLKLHVGKEAGEQASKQASKHASKQASMHACMHVCLLTVTMLACVQFTFSLLAISMLACLLACILHAACLLAVKMLAGWLVVSMLVCWHATRQPGHSDRSFIPVAVQSSHAMVARVQALRHARHSFRAAHPCSDSANTHV